MPGRFSGLHYKFIRFCTNLFKERPDGWEILLKFSAPKYGEEEV
jgi:hypothetical protein